VKQLLPVFGAILLFSLAGAVFVAAEAAMISLRDSQVKKLSASRRGKRLEALIKNPNRFLGSVQVGLTFTGFFSAAYGEKQIVPILVPYLEDYGLEPGTAEVVALIASIITVAFIALVIAELTPKRLALQHAERYALLLAAPVDFMAKVFAPFIKLVSISTDLCVRILGGDPKAGKEQITGEELRGMVAAHEDLSPTERNLIDDVFEAGDRAIREIMVPRTEVSFLDGDLPAFKAAKIVSDKPHSRYPVSDESEDDIVGFVHVRDLLDYEMRDRSIRVKDLSREIPRLPGSRQVIPALTDMRAAGAHMAIVVDEYGGTAGIITMEDLVEELIGDIRDEYDTDESEGVIAPGHDVVVDGLMNLADFETSTGIELVEGPYETVGGFVASELGRIPMVGDDVETDVARMTVIEMDGRRVSRVRVIKVESNSE
jgi:putative hemolysin